MRGRPYVWVVNNTPFKVQIEPDMIIARVRPRRVRYAFAHTGAFETMTGEHEGVVANSGTMVGKKIAWGGYTTSSHLPTITVM